ncbi:MAG: hypothetical protein HOE53_04550 [Candidatus Magasanikbacteria bacterium]|nr:hypothetical protein [Candidatus Magasanikbacteria bacterium]
MFRHPERAFFVRELTRELDTQINAVRRELSLLLKSSIVSEAESPEGVGDNPGGKLRKYYKLNMGSLMYPELQALLMKAKVMGEQEFIDMFKDKCGDVQLLMLGGCFTGDVEAVTDMLVVGNLKNRVAEKLIAEYEKEFGHGIRYTFMTKVEFLDRRHVMDKFIFDFFETNHLKVVNELGV